VNIEQAAIQIADETMILDIQSMCRRVKHPQAEHGQDPWWDTSAADPVTDGQYIARAVNYLEARGRLVRHPRADNLIQILEAS